MKTTTPSCSALAQNGWNFGSLISAPLTLPPIPAPRSPYFFTPSSSCSAARSGYCSATVAKATKRSGFAAHASASFSFWSLMIWRARSRSAVYQFGLMLRASTSMPCSSIARSRVDTSVAMLRSGRYNGPPNFKFISASASGTAQCAWTSTVFTRLPLTTTSRRRACARAGAAAISSHPTNARPASAPLVVRRNSLRVVVMAAPLRSGGHPPVRQATTTFEGRGRRAAQPHFEGLLHRQRRELDVAETAAGAVVAHRLARPEAPQQRKGLVDEGAAALRVDADGIALRRVREPWNERDEQPPFAQHVQACELLGEPQHVASRQEHRGPELQARIARGCPGEAHHGIEHGGGQHLREPQRVEPEPIQAREELRQYARRRERASGPHADADLHVNRARPRGPAAGLPAPP